MNTFQRAGLHAAAITLACLRGVHEFVALQGWRLRDRLRQHRPQRLAR